MKDRVYVVVLDFSRPTVNCYEIEKEEIEEIANEIGSEVSIDELDAIVLAFLDRHEHNESECQYMFSTEPIAIYYDHCEIERH